MLYFSIAHLCYTKICLWHWLHGLPLLCSAHFMNFLIESGSNFHKYSITDGTNPMALIPTIKWGFCEVGVCKIKLFLLPRYFHPVCPGSQTASSSTATLVLNNGLNLPRCKISQVLQKQWNVSILLIFEEKNCFPDASYWSLFTFNSFSA